MTSRPSRAAKALLALVLGLLAMSIPEAAFADGRISTGHGVAAYAPDTASYTYDAPVPVSTSNAATTNVRGSPAEPVAVSWGRLGFVDAYSVAAEGVPEIAQTGDTVLYQKLSSTGEHLKYGITKNPATRYTPKELGGGYLNTLARGSRQDMLALERSLHETLPIGPEEGQLFYIQKQIANGLRPPPYPW